VFQDLYKLPAIWQKTSEPRSSAERRSKGFLNFCAEE